VKTPMVKNFDGQNVKRKKAEWDKIFNGKKQRLGQKIKKCRLGQDVEK
jgi:hypothetical protein